METITPTKLFGRSVPELWTMRKQVASELQALATKAEGRAYSYEENVEEENLLGNLKTLDARLDNEMRDASQRQAFGKYDGLTRQSLTERDMELDEWARESLKGKRPGEFTLEPEQRGDTLGQPGLEYQDTSLRLLPKRCPCRSIPRLSGT
jgi:hypothetical protein